MTLGADLAGRWRGLGAARAPLSDALEVGQLCDAFELRQGCVADDCEGDLEGNTQPCTLAAQLQPLSALVGRGYADPEQRVRDWTSENSGDIVPLANMNAGKYCFETMGLYATHGSLTEADALIPLAVAYPGATGTPQEDDLLKTVLELLAGIGMPGNPIKSPTETRTMERFFGIP